MMVLSSKFVLQRAHMSVGGLRDRRWWSRTGQLSGQKTVVSCHLEERCEWHVADLMSVVSQVYRTTYMPSAVSAKSTGRSQNEADAKILAHLRYLIYASCCRVSAGMFDVWCTARAYNAFRNQHCRSFDDPGPGGLRHRLSTKNVCVALAGGRVKFAGNAGTASRARRHAASSSHPVNQIAQTAGEPAPAPAAAPIEVAEATPATAPAAPNAAPTRVTQATTPSHRAGQRRTARHRRSRHRRPLPFRPATSPTA